AGRIRPGDMYLLNDPYHGGNHLPDLTVLLPVFVGERLAFWSINRAHQSDIGGATHGAYNPGATEIWQEGIRIPPLKLYDAGTLRDDHGGGGRSSRQRRAPEPRVHPAMEGRRVPWAVCPRRRRPRHREHQAARH